MKKSKNKYILIPIAVSIICAILLGTFNILNISVLSKSYTSFEKDISKNLVSKVYITNSPNIDVLLKNGSIYKTDNPRLSTFKAQLLNENIKVAETPYVPLIDVFPITILTISLITTIVMLKKSKPFNSKKLFSVDSIDLTSVENADLNFNHVAGNEEAKESAKDIVDFLKHPDKYYAYGARMPKGVILYGDPGTGKTLLAKAIAGEAKVPFYAMSGSDFVQIYVGVGASRVRQLFKKARSHGKAVIFIDEIDAIGKKRDNSGAGSSDERDQTLNALLTEMSGFNEGEGIVVIAATNRLDMLDKALLRPGRFDRHIEVSLPDFNARKKILSLHLTNKPTNNIDLDDLAYKTAYFSGAKLENLVNEAAIIACKETSEFIEHKHVNEAYSIVIAGQEKLNYSHISEKDRRTTAFHEAGHALLSLKLLPEEKVSKVSIIPTTKGAGGYTLTIPKDSLYQSKAYIMKKIIVLLGGRIAEELAFTSDYVTTGAHNDLKESSRLIENMITKYGMGESLGLVSLSDTSLASENIRKTAILECRETLNLLYNEGLKILRENFDLLTKISETLLKVETLEEQDLLKIVL